MFNIYTAPLQLNGSLGIVFYNHLFLFLVFAVYNMLSEILSTIISENFIFILKLIPYSIIYLHLYI
jgi:hypothetical protein